MLAIGLADAALPTPTKKTKTTPQKAPEKEKQKIRRNPSRSAKSKPAPLLSDSETASDPPADESEEPLPDAGWRKCRDPELTPTQLNKLAPALKGCVNGPYFQQRYPRGKYYVFARRVCRAYVAEWKKQHADELHINRENIARAAVAKVYGQVRPWSDKPHHGNTQMGVIALLPVIEEVLTIPSYACKPGSDLWLKKITAMNRSVSPLS